MPLDCGDTIFTFHLADCEALQFAGFRLERLFLAGSTELVTRCLYIYRLADKSRAVSGTLFLLAGIVFGLQQSNTLS